MVICHLLVFISTLG